MGNSSNAIACCLTTGPVLVYRYLRYRIDNHFWIKKFFLFAIIILGTINIDAQNRSIKLPFTISETEGFAENRGQVVNQNLLKNKEVKYLFHSKGLNVQLKKNSFSYDTYEILSRKSNLNSNNTLLRSRQSKDSTVYHFHRVDIQFPGSNSSPKIVAEDPLINYTTYCNSGDREGIHVNKFKKVTYKEIYPHIDLIFESKSVHNEAGFEYYFIVKPGGDGNNIRIKYSGAGTKLENNCIIIPLEKRKISETIPLSFVTEGGAVSLAEIKNKSSLKVNYKQVHENTYGFRIPAYDKTKTFIIDPVPDLVWGTYYGGSINDWAFGIATCPDGNIVVGGVSDNDNLATSGAFQATLNGYSDAIIGKFTKQGNLLWMTYYGGEAEDEVNGICTDRNGNIYVDGITDSKTGMTTPGCFQPLPGNPAYDRDGFIAKFNESGNRIWSTYYGGNDADYLDAIKIDLSGNIFVDGWTYSTNGISTPGCFQPLYASDSNPMDLGDGFIARFDNNGKRIWGTYFGSTSFDRFYALDIDNNSNLYATGITNSSTNIASPGAFQSTLPGASMAALLVKFGINGNRVWSTYYGGNQDDYAQAVVCDKQNNIIIAGVAQSTSNLATTGTFQPTFGGAARDAFVAKFNSSGNRIWGTYYGGTGEDMIYGITSDLQNNIIVSGSTYSINNIATANSYQTNGPAVIGDWTSFIAKLNPAGNRIWGTYYGYGGLNSGIAFATVCDSAGHVFVCGATGASTNVSTCNAVQRSWAGNLDMFVGMFSENVIPLLVSASITSDPSHAVCSGVPITFNAAAVNGGSNPSYQWQVNGVNEGTDSSEFSSTTLKNGDVVSCILTSSIPCIVNPRANSNLITIAISPSVTPSVSITSSATGSVCSNTPVTFTATPAYSGNSPSYQWQINGTNVGGNTAVFTTSNLSNGDAVECILTNLASCNVITTAASNIIVVNVSATFSPSITINGSLTEACSGTPVIFAATEYNGGSNPTYDWKLNGVSVGSGSTYENSNLAEGDSVQCFLILDNSACNSTSKIPSNKISIVIDPLPGFTIQPINPKISLGDTLQLSISDTSGILKYKWSSNLDISNDSISNPRVWPSSTQTYSLEATSNKDCKTTAQVVVEVITHLYIPNAFTPNNDGINDTWDIKGLEIYPKCTVNIYNRFGELVFKSLGYRLPWNGNFKGNLQPLGALVYIIDLKDGSKPITGTLTILR